jgi:hypothetical protein
MKGVPFIKKWSPKHDAVIGMHLARKSNIEIAESTGYQVVRVSQIINDPTGQKLIREAQKAIRLQVQENIGDRVLIMAETGSKRLMETIEAEFTPGSEAKKHQDNKVIDILKGTGFLSSDFRDADKAVANVSNDVAKKLTDAIHKASQAERYKEDIPTADFEIINE